MMVTLLVSCKKDDGDEALFLLNNSNLEGIHYLNYLQVDVYEVFEINGIPISSTMSIEGSTFQVAFEFFENGTYVASGEYLVTITTTVAGQSNVDTEIIVLDEAGTYVVNTGENTITVTDSTLQESTFDVSVFNEYEMIWYQDISETGGDGSINMQTEMRFER